MRRYEPGTARSRGTQRLPRLANSRVKWARRLSCASPVLFLYLPHSHPKCLTCIHTPSPSHHHSIINHRQVPRYLTMPRSMPRSIHTAVVPRLPTMADFDALMSAIKDQGTWRGPNPSLFIWTLLVHAELEGGSLGMASQAFTEGLHELTDNIKNIQEYYDVFLPESFSPIHTKPLGQILATCGENTATQIIAAILTDPGYPPRPLRRWDAEDYVEGLWSYAGCIKTAESCLICLKSLGNDAGAPVGVDHVRRVTPCGHVFGHDCLVDSLAETNNLCLACHVTLAV